MIGNITLNRQTIFLKLALDLIEAFIFGLGFQSVSQPYRYTNYFQDDYSQTQRCSISRAQNLFLGCFLVKTIRVLLPRLPTERGESIVVNQDSPTLARSISSSV